MIDEEDIEAPPATITAETIRSWTSSTNYVKALALEAAGNILIKNQAYVFEWLCEHWAILAADSAAEDAHSEHLCAIANEVEAIGKEMLKRMDEIMESGS